MSAEFFSLRDGKVFLLDRMEFLSLTVRQVIDGPYVIKWDHPDGVRRYVGNDQAYESCIKRGTVVWLHEFFGELCEVLRLENFLDMKVSDVAAALMINLAENIFGLSKAKEATQERLVFGSGSI